MLKRSSTAPQQAGTLEQGVYHHLGTAVAMQMLVLRLLPIFCIAAAMLAGCGSAGSPGPNATTAASSDVEFELAADALRDIHRANPPSADARRGQQVVMGAAPCERAARCFACVTCHGIRGQGSAAARQPRLAGQIYPYLYRSLVNFASGRRENPTMQAVAAGLTEQQMRDAAAYYAAMPAEQLEITKAITAENAPTPEALAQGSMLAAMGSASGGLQPCATCHGSSGEGLSPLYPALAGQYPSYLEQQLQAYKAGTRRSEEALLMRPIAERLSGEQMRAVALYYGFIPSKGIRTP
jgi:cytochrome c553